MHNKITLPKNKNHMKSCESRQGFLGLCQNYQTKPHLNFNILIFPTITCDSTFIPNKAQATLSISANRTVHGNSVLLGTSCFSVLIRIHTYLLTSRNVVACTFHGKYTLQTIGGRTALHCITQRQHKLPCPIPSWHFCATTEWLPFLCKDFMLNNWTYSLVLHINAISKCNHHSSIPCRVNFLCSCGHEN